MRTTFDIDEAVLAAARSLAAAQKVSLGAAVSELGRRGLGIDETQRARVDVVQAGGPFAVLVGDPRHLVTPELVQQFRDDD